MSLLSKLNPIQWIKDALVSDYVGGLIRHGLTFVGAFLVAKGLAAPEVAGEATSALYRLLTSPEFIGGLMSIFGYGGSVANKKV